MFDSLTQSADGLFVLLFVIALVIFFLFWPHKVYESLFGCLIGLWMYLFIHEMTFVYPEITRSIFMGDFIMKNRGTLLWMSKCIALVLFFVTPMTLGLNVSGVPRGTVLFFLKTSILSAVFISFWIVLFSLLSLGSWVFWEVALIPTPLRNTPYFQNSFLYSWFTDKSLFIILIAFILCFYKIIFSHWMSRLFLVWGVVYLKWNEIFWKKSLDTVIHAEPASHESDESHGESHH